MINRIPYTAMLFALLISLTSGCGGGDSAEPSLTIDAAQSDDISKESKDVVPDTSEEASDVEDVLASPEDAENVEEAPIPKEPILQGTSDGDGLIVQPDMLEGLFVYGIGVDPQSAMAYIGNTPAGALAVAASIELDEGIAHIRLWDLEYETPIEGDAGIIESYPYQDLGEKGIRLDFEMPTKALEVYLGGNCTYGLQTYILASPPLYQDDLITWPVVESYRSENCGNSGLPQSYGMNVHFLKRFETSSDYTPREADPESPFGFFVVQSGNKNFLSRLPHTGGDALSGEILYHIDPDFPPHLRELVDEVFDGWNDAVQETAGNRPFATIDGGPAIVPWDPRYRVVSWDPSQSRGAVAPFIPHPKTGEMLDTDVIVWLGNLPDMVASYAEFFEANPDIPFDFGFDEDIPLPSPEEEKLWVPEDWNMDANIPPNVLRRKLLPHRTFGIQQIHEIFNTMSMSVSSEEIEELIVLDFITHELGHNLGLRHNFKGSIDRTRHPEKSTSTTVMDYVIGMRSPGSYDYDALRYGYGEGAEEKGYLFCTDEDVEYDPACTRWDIGHPILHLIAKINAMIAAFPPGSSEQDIAQASQWGLWDQSFRELRQFLNTDYQFWDPEASVDVFQILMDWALCTSYESSESEATDEGEESENENSDESEDSEGDENAEEGQNDPPPPSLTPLSCDTHIWFRNQLGLYLLYTRYVVGNEWQFFPELSTQQIDTLFGQFFEMIRDPAQPLALKQTIINKLPTTAIDEAADFLLALKQYFSGINEPTADEAQILEWILAATQG